jgi:hypothetical protein
MGKRDTPEKRAAYNAYMREYQRTHPEQKRQQDYKRYHTNIEESRRKGRERRAANPEHFRARSREDHYQRSYGMSVADKKKMFETQKGLCHICGKMMPSWEKSRVDHNHLTEEVRGLAHHLCNVWLGVIENLSSKDPETLMNMLRISNFRSQE